MSEGRPHCDNCGWTGSAEETLAAGSFDPRDLVRRACPKCFYGGLSLEGEGYAPPPDIRDELELLKDAALSEAVTTAIKLAEGLQEWRSNPLCSPGYSALELKAAHIVSLLGGARAYAMASTMLD